jgi:hypothetical protein
MTEELIHQGKVIKYSNLKTLFENKPILFDYIVSEMKQQSFEDENNKKEEKLIGIKVEGMGNYEGKKDFVEAYIEFFLDVNKFWNYKKLQEVIGKRGVVRSEEDFCASGKKALLESKNPKNNIKFTDYTKLNDCWLYTKIGNVPRLDKIKAVCDDLKIEMKPIYR